MKDVIDVLELQREKSRKVPPIVYEDNPSHFLAVHFIFECGIKLAVQPLTVSTAALLYHKFFKEAEKGNYDSYLIASTCLYLAGKIKDDPLKTRDVINVSHNTLHRDSSPLELGEEYWNKRDAIVQTELLIMRMLKFDVNFIHPQKYLFHYLKSLQNWMTTAEWRSAPLAKAAAAFLQDFHHDASVLEYKPQYIAIAAINLALQIYGVTVPLTDESDTNQWYLVFVSDLPKDKLWEIMDKMMDTYEREVERYGIV